MFLPAIYREKMSAKISKNKINKQNENLHSFFLRTIFENPNNQK